jgi:hypothetical protein
VADTSWATRLAAVARRRFRPPVVEPSVASDTDWATHVDGQRRGLYCRPTANLAGPGVDDLLRYTLNLIATSIYECDGRAEAWTNYVIAVGNQSAHEDDDSDTRAPLAIGVCEAWDELMAELPDSFRMSLIDACAVAQLLDRTARGALHEIGRRP